MKHAKTSEKGMGSNQDPGGIPNRMDYVWYDRLRVRLAPFFVATEVCQLLSVSDDSERPTDNQDRPTIARKMVEVQAFGQGPKAL